MAVTSKQVDDLLREICDAIVDCVRASGSKGEPGGTLYALLMSAGCTLEQFNQIMSGLVKAGKVVKRGELYFVEAK